MQIELVRPKFVSLKNHPTLNEHWLHQQLQNDPALLQLGDLEVIGTERRQPSRGRLDLLLRDPESLARYEVEIQLGATDETHLVRTIEYWDIEKRRYPQYEHTAVIVAEDITSRFLNVISLFNGFIPLIAIQLKGVEIADKFALIATKVLDVVHLGIEEIEDEGEIVDRAYWEHRSSSETLSIVDGMVELIQHVVAGIEAKFNKHYIGLAKPGSLAQNFVMFVPRQEYLIAQFRIAQDRDLTEELSESGLDLMPPHRSGKLYRIRLNQTDLRDEERSKIISKLIRAAYDQFPSK